MSLLSFHKRLFLLNLLLLVLVFVLGLKTEEATSPILRSLVTVPFTALGSFLFNRWQARSRNLEIENPAMNVDASAIESKMVFATFFVILSLGLGCAATVLFAPEYASRAAWVLPCLGWNLGHNTEALERLSRRD
ncbi:MAG: hypothetical protein O9256_04465 [Rhizobiaceae bacterium]|jgi:hypothetical protein|nr:hypothetical protein [Rhizobiaceae bacterium]